LSSAQKIDLGLTGYDELFMSDAGRAENRLPKIYDIPLTEIDDFPDHPFKVMLDEDMDQLVQSVKERGIITPITLRQKEDGRYEIVSGHRRKKACELAGLETVKSEIKELTRDEAIILMVESNYQRSSILPSEKAFAYKMRLEAMKRQAGRPTQDNYSPVGNNSLGVKSSDEMAEAVGESKNQIFRYIRLTELSPDLLNMVDENKIAFRPAVELSYLKEDEQKSLLEAMTYADATPSLAQAIKMKEFSKNGKLTPEVMESIMGEEKPNQKEKFTFKAERLRQFIPSTVPYEKTEDYVLKALEYYHRYQERQKERSQER
jgi:ParB family chromosome partitioning protein